MLRQIQKHKTSKKSKTPKKLKSMKGGKCCKCYGGRGAWGTSCYDDPSNCCGKKTKAIRDMDKMMNNIRNRKEARKKSVITKTKKAISSFTKSLKNMWGGAGTLDYTELKINKYYNIDYKDIKDDKNKIGKLIGMISFETIIEKNQDTIVEAFNTALNIEKIFDIIESPYVFRGESHYVYLFFLGSQSNYFRIKINIANKNKIFSENEEHNVSTKVVNQINLQDLFANDEVL